MKDGAKGISKRWVPGRDARVDIREASGLSRVAVDKVLDALWRHVVSNPRTKIVGIGVFEWRRWRHPIPTGRMVETWRLAFKPSQYLRRGRKNGGAEWVR